MDLRTLYHRALSEDSYRGFFIDSIVNSGLPKSVGRLIYNPIQLRDKEDVVLMRILPNPLVRLFIKGTKSDVEIFPAAFLSDVIHRRLDDFLSTLEDHEYFHAQEFYENPRLIAYPIWRSLELVRKSLCNDGFEDYVNTIKERGRDNERRAIDNQISKFPQRDCSPEYKLYWTINMVMLNPNPQSIIIPG